jgi:hypothetical protein
MGKVLILKKMEKGGLKKIWREKTLVNIDKDNN